MSGPTTTKVMGGIVRLEDMPPFPTEPSADLIDGCGLLCWGGTMYVSRRLIELLAAVPADDSPCAPVVVEVLTTRAK